MNEAEAHKLAAADPSVMGRIQSQNALTDCPMRRSARSPAPTRSRSPVRTRKGARGSAALAAIGRRSRGEGLTLTINARLPDPKTALD